MHPPLHMFRLMSWGGRDIPKMWGWTQLWPHPRPLIGMPHHEVFTLQIRPSVKLCMKNSIVLGQHPFVFLCNPKLTLRVNQHPLIPWSKHQGLSNNTKGTYIPIPPKISAMIWLNFQWRNHSIFKNFCTTSPNAMEPSPLTPPRQELSKDAKNTIWSIQFGGSNNYQTKTNYLPLGTPSPWALPPCQDLSRGCQEHTIWSIQFNGSHNYKTKQTTFLPS